MYIGVDAATILHWRLVVYIADTVEALILMDYLQ